MKRSIALFLLLAGAIGLRAQSTFKQVTYPAVVMTASGQTSTPIQLDTYNGSYSAGVVAITGSSLTTATVAVYGTSLFKTNFVPLAVESCDNPGTFSTTVTVTAGACYQVNLAGMAYIEFVTSGTFTATSISLTLTASPNAQVGRAGGGGGGGGCTGATGTYSLNNQVATVNSGCVTSIGSAFSMGLSCGQAGTYETGYATTNPFNCTLSYANGTPASATLGDGTNTDTLTTPYTSGSLAFAYSTNTTFTAHSTATNSQTASATASFSLLAREFAGVGTAGATGATASGTSAVLVGATGTLPSAGLGTHSSYGPFSPSNQKIYVLGLNPSCTFTSGGFAFPTNAPLTITFVNQYGASITIYDYESANLLSATFTLNGTC